MNKLAKISDLGTKKISFIAHFKFFVQMLVSNEKLCLKFLLELEKCLEND